MLGQVVVLSGGSSLVSGKVSGEGLHNVGLYHCQDNTPRLLVKIRLS